MASPMPSRNAISRGRACCSAATRCLKPAATAISAGAATTACRFVAVCSATAISSTARTRCAGRHATSSARVRTKSRSWSRAVSIRRPTLSSIPSSRTRRFAPQWRRRRRRAPMFWPTPTAPARSTGRSNVVCVRSSTATCWTKPASIFCSPGTHSWCHPRGLRGAPPRRRGGRFSRRLSGQGRRCPRRRVVGAREGPSRRRADRVRHRSVGRNA